MRFESLGHKKSGQMFIGKYLLKRHYGMLFPTDPPLGSFGGSGVWNAKVDFGTDLL